MEANISEVLSRALSLTSSKLVLLYASIFSNNGAIKFNSDEISQLCEVLEVSPLKLFNSESIIFNNNNQQGGNFGQYIALPEELQKQYELRIKEKDEMIAILKEELSILKSVHKETDK